MEFILPNIYEEILQRNFEEEALILKDDQLMSILLLVHEKSKVQRNNITETKENLNILVNTGYVREENDSFLLTQKGVNFLKLLGISSKYIDKSSLLDIEHEVIYLYNYAELLKLSKIEIFRYLSISNKESNEFLRFDKNNSTLECTLFLNCFSNINDFLIKLKSILDNETKIILYYQNSIQRRDSLTKSYYSLSRVLFPLVDLLKTRLKHLFIKRRKLKYLLFYNSKYPRAEVLGRISYSGYRIIEESFTAEYSKIIVRPDKKSIKPKTTEPKYSSLIKLPRIGKEEKIIYIYKFRTMYPYSEYIQDYVYQINNINKKYGLENDFRITKMGKFLRKIWLDELPMFLNFFKGDVKLVGIRPLSKLYLDLYPEDLRQFRSHFKPGLIPPFYADFPSDLEGILKSERKYLESYSKNPWMTDLKYYFKSLGNILFHRDN